MPFPSECRHQKQATTLGHVYIWGGGGWEGRRTHFADQSSRFTHHPLVSALEFAFPEYRKEKRQILGLSREFVFSAHSKAQRHHSKLCSCKRRQAKVNCATPAPAGHHCKAMLSNIHPLESPLERASRAASTCTPTRAQSPRRSHARLG